ncbi:MAG TPA: prolyl oligopeptidase family serine peptidase [Anaerolineales bacterium]|nr:prolyl oligopeptidase family serine peptidase [Anaerolineales bacterium]
MPATLFPALAGRLTILLGATGLALAACQSAPTGDSGLPTSVALVTSAPATALPPTGTPAPATSTPTATETETATPSPTPTLHPMSIAAARLNDYAGSDLVVEQELDPGVNYQRYYVSYLSEGLKIYALLTIPNGEPPATGWPAIAFNHGFIPPDVYRTTERYIAYVDRIAQAGYVVLRSDYRGHDQSEGEATGAYGSPGYVTDVLNGVGALKRHPLVDPNRIGMWGHSMGGYITLRSMVISSDIKAGVIWGGVVAPYPDLFARGTPTVSPGATAGTPTFRGGWRRSWVEQFGTRDENPAFWDSISANAYLADLSGPIQLHHGTTDETVPFASSQTLYDQMAAVGEEVEFYAYEGDNHNLSGFFTTAMNRSIEFFDRYVKGAP